MRVPGFDFRSVPRADGALLVTVGVVAMSAAQTPVIRTIDSAGDVGTGVSIATFGGKLIVACIDETNHAPKLWFDDGAGGGTANDGVANGAEIRTIDNAHSTQAYTSGAGVSIVDGRIAVAYLDRTNNDLLLWYDDGAGDGSAGDIVANGSEIRIIESTGAVGDNFAITSLSNKIAIAYHDITNDELHLWYDDGAGGGTAGDGNANGSEVRVIDTNGTVGDQIAITTLGGVLAVAYQDYGNNLLRVWIDDGAGGGVAGDGNASGNEIRNFAASGFFNSIYAFHGHLVVAYFDDQSLSLRMWYDDGAGGGIADDGLANGSEIRIIDAPAMGSGFYTSITSIHNRLAVCGFGAGPNALRLWYDDGDGGGTPDDNDANGSETRVLTATGVAYYSSLTTWGTTLVIAYYDTVGADLKLAMFETPTAPDAPSALGATGLVNGSNTTDTTPTLEFTQSDLNSADTLAFRIQIDDSSDFSSPVVDFTSAAAAQGATSFTVGQAAGGGTYTVGAAAQTLALGGYYWRVRTSDETFTSAWATASSGGVAFVVVATPTVTTTAASSITTVSAASGGNISSAGTGAVTARGVCWSMSHNPTTSESHTTDGTGAGAFSSAITGLTPGATYYVRAYATNSIGTAYGNEVSFSALPTTPTVTTTAASSVSTTTATAGGNVVALGGAAVTTRGVCWSIAPAPTIASSHTSDGSGAGAFASGLTGLQPATVYYFRAYATNTTGTAYGSQEQFTTESLPPEPTPAPDPTPSPDPTPTPEPEPTPTPAPPNLSVFVTALDASVEADSDVSFEISIQNEGMADAMGVVVTIPLPANVDFVSADLVTDAALAVVARPTVAVNNGVVTLTFDALHAGAAARVKLVLRPAESGDIALTVSLSAEGLVAGVTAEAPGVTVEDAPTLATPRGFCGFGAHFGLLGALAGAGVMRRARKSGARRRNALHSEVAPRGATSTG